jgi:Ca-activated chloride channel family protein
LTDPLADGSANPPDPVAGLVDFPLPQEVSLWPQTWEARLAAVVLLMALVASVWRFLRYRRVNRYRREALSALSRIGLAAGISSERSLADLALLVRQTALAAFAREQVAPLSGKSWLAFLDKSYDGQEFSQGVGRLLASGPYQQLPPGDAELKSLLDLVRRWIRGHHA